MHNFATSHLLRLSRFECATGWTASDDAQLAASFRSSTIYAYSSVRPWQLDDCGERNWPWFVRIQSRQRMCRGANTVHHLFMPSQRDGRPIRDVYDEKQIAPIQILTTLQIC